MKIIETKDHSFKKVCTCAQCSTKFEVELSDIQMKTSNINTQNWDVYFVICPTCSFHKEIAHDFDDVYYGACGALSDYQKTKIKQRRINRDGM